MKTENSSLEEMNNHKTKLFLFFKILDAVQQKLEFLF